MKEQIQIQRKQKKDALSNFTIYQEELKQDFYED